MSLRERIETRLDALQHWMETDYHLERPDEVMELSLSISKFWSVLSEEDREYVQYAQLAIEDKLSWKGK
jgi:hypothetical protein